MEAQGAKNLGNNLGERKNSGANLQSALQRKTSFCSSQPRFQQYNKWANKTSVFLGPGVYDDNENFISYVKQPCSAVYVISPSFNILYRK